MRGYSISHIPPRPLYCVARFATNIFSLTQKEAWNISVKHRDGCWVYTSVLDFEFVLVSDVAFCYCCVRNVTSEMSMAGNKCMEMCSVPHHHHSCSHRWLALVIRLRSLHCAPLPSPLSENCTQSELLYRYIVLYISVKKRKDSYTHPMRAFHLPLVAYEPIGGCAISLWHLASVSPNLRSLPSLRERHHPLTGTKLYCLVTEAQRCK